MIKWLSNLLTRSAQVKNETTNLANTAIRVGSLLEDLAQSGVFPYDATYAYKAGQYVVFGGVLASAVADTVAGESPSSAPLKWSLQLVTDPAQVTLSNKLPISASAVRAVINQAANGGDAQPGNATETTRGLARQATDEEVYEGVNNDAYTTAKHLQDKIAGLSEFLTNPKFIQLLANATDDEVSSFLSEVFDRADGPTITAINARLGAYASGLTLQEIADAFGFTIINPGNGLGNTIPGLDGILTVNPVSDQSPVLTGTGNYLTKQLSGGQNVDRGHVHVGPDGTVLSATGHSATGSRFFDILGQRVAEWTSTVVTFARATFLDARLADAFFDKVSVRSPEIGDYTPAGYFAPYADTLRGGFNAKVRSTANLAADVMNALVVADWRAKLGLPPLTIVAGDARPVLDVKCGPVTTGGGGTVIAGKPFKITSAMVGIAQTHGLNVDGTGLFKLLLDVNGDPDSSMSVSFPTVNTFRVDYRPGISEYPGGSLLLTPY